MEKYGRHSWMQAETYNNIIHCFGKRFDDYTPKELS